MICKLHVNLGIYIIMKKGCFYNEEHGSWTQTREIDPVFFKLRTGLKINVSLYYVGAKTIEWFFLFLNTGGCRNAGLSVCVSKKKNVFW